MAFRVGITLKVTWLILVAVCAPHVGFMGLGRFQAPEVRLDPNNRRADQPLIWSPYSQMLSLCVGGLRQYHARATELGRTSMAKNLND